MAATSMASSFAALQTRGLTADLGHGAQRRTVLREVDLRWQAGRWISIIGPNGAGKSTLLKAVAGLIPASGEVRLFDRPLADWRHRERAQTLSWLAQNGSSDSGVNDLTAYDVAMLGRLPHRGWLAPPGGEDHVAVEQALRRTGAWEWRERSLGTLSGGERQRVLLARLLAVGAPLMLMDEPLANLDPPHQADWIALVRELVAQGLTVVSVLHEISVALMADDMVVMRDGKLCFSGTCESPEAHQAINDVFDHCLDIVRVNDRWVALQR